MFQLLRIVLFSFLLHGALLLLNRTGSQLIAAPQAGYARQSDAGTLANLSLNEALSALSQQHNVIFEFNDNLLKIELLTAMSLTVSVAYLKS